MSSEMAERCSKLTFLNLCELHWGTSPYDQAIEDKLGYSIEGWEGDCPFKGEEEKCPGYRIKEIWPESHAR